MPAQLTSDPYDILLGHNRWAIRTLLEHSRELTPDEFHRHFDIGPGSLHDTLTHLIGAMLRWADRIDARVVKPSIERASGIPAGNPGAPADASEPMIRRTPDELLAILDEAARSFADAVARAKATGTLGETRDWVFSFGTYRFNVAAAIIHVTNHGMHHRAQCLNMFKRLGKPLNKDLDELEWQCAGEP